MKDFEVFGTYLYYRIVTYLQLIFNCDSCILCHSPSQAGLFIPIPAEAWLRFYNDHVSLTTALVETLLLRLQFSLGWKPSPFPFKPPSIFGI